MQKIGSIKPYRRKAAVNDSVDTLWSKLDNAITLIQEHRESKLSFEELYRTAYQMCVQSHDQELVKRVTNKLKARANKLRQGIEECIGIDRVAFLKKLSSAYSMYCLGVIKMSDILMYLDKQYRARRNLPTIFTIAMGVFESEVVMAANLNSELQDALLVLLDEDREGKAIERSVVKACTSMLVQLGADTSDEELHVYNTNIGKRYLDRIDNYYRNASQRLLEQNTCSWYVSYTVRHLQEEEDRCDHCLHEETKEAALKLLRRRLLEDHIAEILRLPQGLTHMIDNKRDKDLRALLTVYAGTTVGIATAAAAVREHVVASGRAAIDSHQSQSRPAVPIMQAILDLRKRFDGVVSVASFDPAVHAAIRRDVTQGFEDFVNELEQAPEYLSLFIDEQLKRGIKALSDSEVEALFDLTTKIFRAITDKDVFERFYKQHFARRLLLNKSASIDAEQSFLQRLQVECGSSYTKKLAAMFRDCTLKDNMMERFREAVKMNEKRPMFDFSVNVLTLGSWPFTQQPPACVLPPQLMQACDVFEQWYHSFHTGRKLTWDFALGQAEIVGVFQNGKKKHIFQVTTLQMIVLLQFRKGVALSTEALQSSTQLSLVRLHRILQCLASSKVRLLKKSPPTKTIAETDAFSVNEKFSSRMVKIRIPQLVSKEATAAEAKDTMKKVTEDRKHEVEACIVRVLKNRKQLHYNDIVVEVTQQLAKRFQPPPLLIKKRLEALIDREFVERDDKDRTLYRYLA
ncbi:hypothetical protein PTSG_09501 [Salpingoeca rosetta]|uniref:Cullin family profile domain-containing protein n=1 Tax=Salpingoeca rosetta (strain ATCC 50818 / BSB-021) TaxID=946362 RepID=F2UL68_SALR5|nr:uncharacterized protein PTSG_09501 [Salpingoeca rosetta]EGD77867.1 hypothetical protein PTSG_09501 [Salpingoeca rosetta]|eukprot:XP_004989931.1 hypothetical protein PTSG_09501 [Salpingoeca rosetta]